ncbi:hypothetical protein QP922_01180 [Corynebacterium sp. MSK218]|uniref:AMIN-like domain-containing (lipo)protein n=1 Tax=Corynebacterium sp. MSK218 TaxID=3050218 RepID=UPI00254F2E6D|nr:hypothetical protein [Corynebacterium sp. MSK218]MDK8762438.1 hypothetical protein [Corynebacterium sp. MSK218]
MPKHTLSRAATSVAAFVASSALVLQGCSVSSDDTSAPTATVDATLSGASTSTAQNATAPAGLTPLGDANLEMKTLRPPVPSELVVTDVRVGKHDGFDRVVFEFTGNGSPGWFIDYADSPAQQGSGNPISYEGATALNVSIDGTAYPFQLDMEDPNIGTVKGAGGMVTQVVNAGTFEARSQFVIGLAGRHPYSVQVLKAPTRLVIDIQN